MWENVARDVEDARNDLSLRRAAALQRHTDELKELDNERDEIESFVRVAAAFAKRYKVQQDSATTPAKEEGDETNSSAGGETNSEKADASTATRSAFSPNFANIIRRAS
jgi:hypothetical protein